MPETITAGNHGDRIRSDCRISFTLKNSGGLEIKSDSKVDTQYGRSNERLIREICSFYQIRHAAIHFEDSGALDWVISARLESAIRMSTGTQVAFINKPALHGEAKSEKDRLRFTRLYLPGNNPSMMINAGIHGPDGIILDLEDSVDRRKKDEARILVRNALHNLDFYGAERMVRINPLPEGLNDLDEIIPELPEMILLPKCEKEEQIHETEERIRSILNLIRKEKDIWLMPIIESAKGVENSYKIATSSLKIAAMALGLEDYTADIGAQRTLEAEESFYARSRVLNACKAAGIQAIDSVFSDVDDEDGLRKTVLRSKQMGFEGLGCIHPRQIAIARDTFLPLKEEIEKARKIAIAFRKAESEGLGVVSLGTKMIDPPVVKRALRTIDLAVKFQLIDSNWEDESNEE